MNSAIYTGKVRHRRFLPKEHKFSYRVYLNWLDLDEIEQIFRLPPLLGKGQFPSFICFNRRKYLTPETNSLKQAVQDKVEADLGFRPQGKVFILTTLQYFGFCFNPVSFYYAYDEHENLVAVAAEINNTPWDQRFTYCLDMRHNNSHDFEKEFHVSPFMPMEMDYRWFLKNPKKTLAIHMQNFSEGQLHFDATLKLKRQKFSYIALFKHALFFPLIPFKVVVGIYYHALRLRLKGIAFHEHPETIN
jgi:uncharacterized protein